MTLGDFTAPSWSDLFGGLMIAAVVGVGVLIEMLRRGFRHVRAIDHAVNNAAEGEPTMREMVQGLTVAVADQRAADARRDEKVEELGRDQRRTDASVGALSTDLRRVERKVDEHVAFHRGVEAAKGQP